MIITYHGAEFFKVQFGDTILAFNPISKDSKIKGAHFGANVALVTLNHPDMNGSENLKFAGREPIVISGAGEYEVGGIFIKGYNSRSDYGGKERINTIYSVSMEGMNLCFLGALSEEKSFSKEVQEAVDGIDILFVPIGGGGVLDAQSAYKLSVHLEPKLVIPMHFGSVGEKDALKVFLKEGGEDGLKPVDKLTLKKKDLDGKEGEIVIVSET